MFKKTLLAAALCAVTSSVTAATLAITGVNISQEGAANDASVPVPNAVVTFNAEYTTNDTVTFTLTGASFDTALSVPTLNAVLLGSDGAVGGLGDAADDAASFGLLTFTSSAITFRITSQTDGGTDGVTYTDNLGGAYANGTLTLAGLVMTTATVVDATGDINMTSTATTNTGSSTP